MTVFIDHVKEGLQMEVDPTKANPKNISKNRGANANAGTVQGRHSLSYILSMAYLKTQVCSDNDASELDILGHIGTIRKTH